MWPEQRWLSTGEAAQLCSVARDTVLKWIRKGRLPASRTAGGHYRIAWQDAVRVGLTREQVAAGLPALASVDDHPMRCWGYRSDSGEPREECRQCLAYRVGASRCFLLRRELGPGNVSFCCGPESCEDCPYYRRVMGLPTRVLVVTADDGLERSLRAGGEEGWECRYARTGYEASAIISAFHPLIAVVDVEVDRGGGVDLVAQLETDPRLHGLRIVLAVARRGARLPQGLAVEVLRKPFGLSDLRAIRDKFPVEPLPVADQASLRTPASAQTGTSDRR